MRMAHESGAGDEDYVQREMIHYEIDTGIPFKLRHCWEILKDRPKWQEIALPKFSTGSGGSKRHKSSGSSSFNTESREASINLNTNVGDNDEDEVQEVQRLEGRDKARAVRKKKGSKASGSSNVNEDALARLMVTEMTTQEKTERLAFLEIKMREVEYREREIEQQDMSDNKEVDDYSEDDSVNGAEEINGDISKQMNLDDETDINLSPNEKENSSDPFNLYNLLNKRDKGEAKFWFGFKYSFPHPGLTPKRIPTCVSAHEGSRCMVDVRIGLMLPCRVKERISFAFANTDSGARLPTDVNLTLPFPNRLSSNSWTYEESELQKMKSVMQCGAVERINSPGPTVHFLIFQKFYDTFRSDFCTARGMFFAHSFIF
ncbi:gamma-glutamyltranspeptidase 1 [Tanacetum coccineum]